MRVVTPGWCSAGTPESGTWPPRTARRRCCCSGRCRRRSVGRRRTGRGTGRSGLARVRAVRWTPPAPGAGGGPGVAGARRGAAGRAARPVGYPPVIRPVGWAGERGRRSTAQEFVDVDGGRLGVQVYPEPAGAAGRAGGGDLAGDGRAGPLLPPVRRRAARRRARRGRGRPARHRREHPAPRAAPAGTATPSWPATSAPCSPRSSPGWTGVPGCCSGTPSAGRPRCCTSPCTTADAVDGLALVAVGAAVLAPLPRPRAATGVLPYTQGIAATAAAARGLAGLGLRRPAGARGDPGLGVHRADRPLPAARRGGHRGGGARGADPGAGGERRRRPVHPARDPGPPLRQARRRAGHPGALHRGAGRRRRWTTSPGSARRAAGARVARFAAACRPERPPALGHRWRVAGRLTPRARPAPARRRAPPGSRHGPCAARPASSLVRVVVGVHEHRVGRGGLSRLSSGCDIPFPFLGLASVGIYPPPTGRLLPPPVAHRHRPGCPRRAGSGCVAAVPDGISRPGGG